VLTDKTPAFAILIRERMFQRQLLQQQLLQQQQQKQEQQEDGSQGQDGAVVVATTSSPPHSQRKGIRRLIFDFIHARYGLSADPSMRMRVLMTDLFVPQHADRWPATAAYLLLALGQLSPDYRSRLFRSNLDDEDKYTALSVDPNGSISGAGGGGGTQAGSSAPLFSLERMKQTLSASQMALSAGPNSSQQRLGSQAGSQRGGGSGGALSSQMPFGASQSIMASRFLLRKLGITQSDDGSQAYGGGNSGKGRFLRGTQEVAWTQTQTPTGSD
jgi:hypothetical protein